MDPPPHTHTHTITEGRGENHEHELEIEKLYKIVDIVEKILEFNNQKQEGQRLRKT